MKRLITGMVLWNISFKNLWLVLFVNLVRKIYDDLPMAHCWSWDDGFFEELTVGWALKLFYLLCGVKIPIFTMIISRHHYNSFYQLRSSQSWCFFAQIFKSILPPVSHIFHGGKIHSKEKTRINTRWQLKQITDCSGPLWNANYGKQSSSSTIFEENWVGLLKDFADIEEGNFWKDAAAS